MAEPLFNEPLDLGVSEANTFAWVAGQPTFVSGLHAVAQLCRIGIKMFTEEWFLDLDAGVRWWQDILGKPPALAVRAAELDIVRVLQATPGVLNVISVDVRFVRGRERRLDINWQVHTKFGDTPVNTIAFTSEGLTP